MTHGNLQAAIAPKVKGTCNLHDELAATNLDFFVLFGSLSGLIGQVGQVNYAAANTFLDAFVQFQHRLDLPGSVLDIGVMGGIGYISEKPSMLAQLRFIGMKTLREQGLLDAFHLAIVRSSPPLSAAHGTITTSANKWFHGFSNLAQLAIGLQLSVPLNVARNQTWWKRYMRMSRYANQEKTNHLSSSDTSNTSNEGLMFFLTTLNTDTSN